MQPTNPDVNASAVSQNDLFGITYRAAEQMRQAGYRTGGQMRHYKGALYRYQGITVRESDLSPEVLYSTSQGIMFTRPVEQFLGDLVMLDNGASLPRFVPYLSPRMQSVFDMFDVKEPGGER